MSLKNFVPTLLYRCGFRKSLEVRTPLSRYVSRGATLTGDGWRKGSRRGVVTSVGSEDGKIRLKTTIRKGTFLDGGRKTF